MGKDSRSGKLRGRAIGTALGLIGSLLLSGTAAAAVTGQTYRVQATPAKQDKKVRGPVGSFSTAIDTAYAPPFTPAGTQTVLTYPKDFKFTPGNAPVCPTSLISSVPETQADAICPGAKHGSGSVTINNGALTGKVAAYRGTPVNGQDVLLLHVDIFTGNTYSFTTTPGGVFNPAANTLSVPIPPTGTALTHFDLTLTKFKTGKKTYFIMARCKKKWVFSETTSFTDGSSITATSTQKCKQKKSKKK
jgi:hypothetical protein